MDDSASSHPLVLYATPGQGGASRSAKDSSAVDDQRARDCVPREFRQIEIQIAVRQQRGRSLDDTRKRIRKNSEKDDSILEGSRNQEGWEIDFQLVPSETLESDSDMYNDNDAAITSIIIFRNSCSKSHKCVKTKQTLKFFWSWKNYSWRTKLSKIHWQSIWDFTWEILSSTSAIKIWAWILTDDW